MNTWIIQLLASAVAVGTTLIFATIGEIIMEKVGHLNLGIEGLMLLGAVSGFGVASQTNNPWLALFASFLAGAMGTLIYAFLTVTLRANQVVTGLALTFFGTGIANFIGKGFSGQVLSSSMKGAFKFDIPVLSQIPIIGEILFKQDFLVYLGIAIALATAFYLNHTRVGLRMKMVGENPSAADAAGIPVNLYKYVHLLIGGGIVALSGAYLSLVYVPSWQENITAGRGWIAVALVIFVSWRPTVAMLGALFFGILEIIGARLQNTAFEVSKYYTDLLPYLITIFVLIISSKQNSKNNAPENLGNNYYREER